MKNNELLKEYELLVESVEKDRKKRFNIYIFLCILIIIICLLGILWSYEGYKKRVSGTAVIFKEADINKWFMINIDLNNDGICDINCDIDNDYKPDYNIDYLGDRIKRFSIDVNDEKKGTKNLVNIDNDSDGICDLNCDEDNNGWPDFNIDLDADNICDINCDNNSDGICDLNCDVNLDRVCDAFCDTDKDLKCDSNCEKDLTCKSNCFLDNKDCILNCDTNHDEICDKNCDTNNDGIADKKIDINNDKKCDINCVDGENGYCYLNCDNNLDGKCDLNCDNNSDGICDYNCDIDGDNKCDYKCDTNSDGICDNNCYLSSYADYVNSNYYHHQTCLISVVFEDINNIDVDNLLPGDTIPMKSFKVINEGNIKAKYNLFWSSVYNDFTILNNLKYNVSSSNGIQLNNLSAPYYSQTFLYGIMINPGDTHTYKLNLSFDDTGINQNIDQGKTFSAKINAKVIAIY